MKKVLLQFDDTFLNLSTIQNTNLNFLKNLFKIHTNKLYIVGGTLRNILLNQKRNDDLDIEIHDISIEVFENIMNDIQASGVGKSFFVYKYNNIDISLPRLESKISYGHKGFSVKLASNEFEASLRRDFTMNSLMYNVYSNELLDLHNGIKDIKNKNIKIVNQKTFIEDSLRVLRAIRFSSVYNLKINNIDIAIMKNMDISDLSKDRINEELKKIFKSNYLEIGFYYMIKTDIFYKLFKYKVSFKEFIMIYRIIKRNKKYFNTNLKEYYFLFIIKKYLNLDFNHLELSNKYKFINKEVMISDNISDAKLKFLATIKPINEYLDINHNIIKKAIILNIYYEKLTLNINIKKILDDGYKGKDIQKQINIEKMNLLLLNK